MTTPQEQAEAFREEIRATLKTIQSRIEQTTNRIMTIENIQADERNTLDELTKAIETVLYGIKHAASATAPASTGDTFAAVKIEREKRKGKYYYKMLGGQFTKHGITVWDEVLEAMGLDKVEYGNDDIHKLDPPLIVRISSEPYTDEEGQPKNRRKVTGRA